MSENVAKKNIQYVQTRYEESVEEMCDMVLDSIREGYQSPLEPWEIYEEKKRMQIKENFAKHRERVTHGFQLILEEMTKKKL